MTAFPEWATRQSATGVELEKRGLELAMRISLVTFRRATSLCSGSRNLATVC